MKKCKCDSILEELAIGYIIGMGASVILAFGGFAVWLVWASYNLK